MKILYITSGLGKKDGWGRYSKSIVDYSKKEGHNVLVISEEGDNGNDTTNRNNKYTNLSNRSEAIGSLISIIKNTIFIQKTINNFRPDIVHFTIEFYIFSIPFIFFGNSKVFFTVHGTYSYYPRLTRNPIKKVLWGLLTYVSFFKIKYIIAVSRYTKKYLLRKLMPFLREPLRKKIKVINNGTPIKKTAKIVKQKNNKTNILIVAPIKKRKGIIEAIKALDAYKKISDRDFKCTIVGSCSGKSKYYNRVKEEIKNSSLIEDQILFTENVSEEKLKSLYAKADLFLMLPIHEYGNFEGFGLVYLEANLYGVPCIGSTHSGAGEAIKENVSGYVVNPYDSEKVAKRMYDIIILSKINYKNCIRWAKKNSFENKSKELFKLYENYEQC